jgi:hypothetical protein
VGGFRHEVEGTQPDTPPAPARTPAFHHRRWWLIIVLAVAVIVVAAVISLYVLTPPPPIPVTVSNGSTTGVMEANFLNYTNTDAPFVQDFNATTYASQNGGPTSALTLRLHAAAVSQYSMAAPGPQGFIYVDIDIVVQGEFASNLRLNGLTLTGNQSGNFSAGQFAMGRTNPNQTNISNAWQGLSWTAGPATFTPTLVNQTGKGPFYEFVYSAFVQVDNPILYSSFVGFRATVTGQFSPSVSVGILFQVVEAPWCPPLCS